MNWHSIALDDVLQVSKVYVPVVDHAQYPYAVLHPYPRGLELRGQKQGVDVRGKQHQTVRSGQFVISRLRAQQRFWGIVPPELDEAVVHRSYLCFDVNPQLNINYFAAYLGTNQFSRAANATRNKFGRLDVRRFARITMPLPTTEEQEHIADIWQYTVKALRHTAEMYTSIAELKVGVATDLFRRAAAAWTPTALGNWATIGRGNGLQYAMYLTPEGQLMRGKTEAQDVAVGILPSTDLDSHFLYYYLEHEKQRWQNALQFARSSVEDAFKTLPVPLPTLYEQRKIVTLLQQHDDALDKLKVEQNELRHLTHGMMQLIFSGKMPYQEALSLMQSL